MEEKKSQESTEQNANSQNEVVDQVITKIKDNDFKIYLYCPPLSNPSGGISVLFKHAKILKNAGYSVSIVYEPIEDKKASYDASMKNQSAVSVYRPFNPTWLGKDGEGVEVKALGNGTLTFSDGTTKDCVPLTLAPEDFLIIPEGFPNIMESTSGLPCKRVILAQSWFYVLNAMPIGQKWQNFGIKDVISVSDGITEYLNAVMPGLSVKQYSQSIDRSLFNKPKNMSDKVPMIVYMGGRGQESQLKTHSVIRHFYAFYPQYRWIRFQELKGMDKEGFSEMMKSASIALFTDDIAGFGTLPLEAMACGTHVVGWTPLGGKEYMNERNGFWVTNGDIFKLAELLGYAVDKYLTNQLDIKEVEEAYEDTLSNYTLEKEAEQLTQIYKDYKNERIEELEKLKQ